MHARLKLTLILLNLLDDFHMLYVSFGMHINCLEKVSFALAEEVFEVAIDGD